MRPGPFRFGDPDLVRRYLSTAGWQDIDHAPAVMPMAVGGARTVEEAVAFALEESAPRRASSAGFQRKSGRSSPTP